jgi:hypothetical protein
VSEGPLTILALFVALLLLAVLFAWAVGSVVAQALGGLP